MALFFCHSNRTLLSHFYQPQCVCGKPCRDEVIFVDEWRTSSHDSEKTLSLHTDSSLSVTIMCSLHNFSFNTNLKHIRFLTVNGIKYKSGLLKKYKINKIISKHCDIH